MREKRNRLRQMRESRQHEQLDAAIARHGPAIDLSALADQRTSVTVAFVAGLCTYHMAPEGTEIHELVAPDFLSHCLLQLYAVEPMEFHPIARHLVAQVLHLATDPKEQFPLVAPAWHKVWLEVQELAALQQHGIESGVLVEAPRAEQEVADL